MLLRRISGDVSCLAAYLPARIAHHSLQSHPTFLGTQIDARLRLP